MSLISPRKIVLLHEHLVNPGGAERLLVEEYKFLKRQGIDTHVLTFAPHHPQALYGTAMPELEVLSRRGVVDGVYTLRRRLIQLAPDLVITGGGVRDLYLATRGTRIPYLLHQHEPPFKALFRLEPRLFGRLHREAFNELQHCSLYSYLEGLELWRPKTIRRRLRAEVEVFLDAWSFQAAHHITVLSYQSAHEIRLLYGRESTVIRGALPSELLERRFDRECAVPPVFSEGKPVILSISRLHKWKRIDMIVRAFATLHADQPDVRLAIGGMGPEEAFLKQLVEQLGIKEAVTFLGFVPDDALWACYAACSLFVLADWTDYDIAPYEALALGRQVVGSAEMEFEPEFQEKGLVFLAEPRPPSYAAAMQRALATPPAATPDMSSYTWDHYFSKVLATHQTRGRGRAASLPGANDPGAREQAPAPSLPPPSRGST